MNFRPMNFRDSLFPDRPEFLKPPEYARKYLCESSSSQALISAITASSERRECSGRWKALLDDSNERNH